MKGFINWIKGLLDPFEVLYVSISVATFKHSMWSVAFMMEGEMPKAGDARYDWYLSGALIAAAVDIGMLVIGRYLQKSKNKTQIAFLALAFFVAALISFYAQLIYTSIHTPEITLSAGVTTGWSHRLMPVINAGVVIFPLSLPILATVITLARIFNHVAERSKTEFSVKMPRQSTMRQKPAMQDVPQIVDGEEVQLLPEVVQPIMPAEFEVNLKDLTFLNKNTGRQYGPYKTTSALNAAMKMAARPRKEEQPASVE